MGIFEAVQFVEAAGQQPPQLLAGVGVDIAPQQRRVLLAQLLQPSTGVAQDQSGTFGSFEQRPAPDSAAARLVFADDCTQQAPSRVVIHGAAGCHPPRTRPRITVLRTFPERSPVQDRRSPQLARNGFSRRVGGSKRNPRARPQTFVLAPPLRLSRMASQCFCGCGRKVRFASKRLSAWGADAERLTLKLQTEVLPQLPPTHELRQAAEMLVVQGRRFQEVFRELIHGTLAAPPTTEGMEFRAAFHLWEDTVQETLTTVQAKARAGQVGSVDTRPSSGEHGGDRVEVLDPKVQRAVESILGRVEQPIPKSADLMLRSFADVLLRGIELVEDDAWSSDDVREMLIGVGRFGYATRVLEEDAYNLDSRVRVLELGIAAGQDKHPDQDLFVIFMVVCDSLATADEADPWAGVRPVTGPPESFRTAVAARTAFPWIFAKSNSGSLPRPLETEHVMRTWRFGFLARCAEMSLPSPRGET